LPAAPAGGPAGRYRAPLLGQTLGGRYLTTALLAEGSVASLYEARHLATGRAAVIKALHPMLARDPDAVRALGREARAAGLVAHPNVCAVFDAGVTTAGGPYFVMERLRGETLADRLERDGAMPIDDAVGVVRQVLGALGAAHERGVVHCDVKPENMFLVERAGLGPFVKLLDFGLSTVDREPPPAAGAIFGSPTYMAPEQTAGDPLDERADLYAVGVVLFQCLTGGCPFAAANYHALAYRIATETPPPLRARRPEASEALEEVVAKALAKDRARRFQSARAFLEALDRAVGAPGPDAAPRAFGYASPDAPA
jgi:serine/threonine-protein kinase